MRLLRRLGPVLLSVLAPLSFAAQTDSIDQRLQRLEQQVDALRSENDQLRTELGLTGPANRPAATPAGDEAALSVGGMLQVQADFGDKGDARFASDHDRFYLRRARINVQGKFLEDFDFRLEGEFAGSLGETTGTRAQLTDGYIGWNRFDFARIRVGQFKTPFGYEQLAADPALFTIERTLVNDRLTVNRQIGLQVAGDLFDRHASYAAGVFNGTGVNTTANDNNQFLWVGRLAAVPWRGQLAGAAAQWSVGTDAYTSRDTGLTGQPAEFGFDAVPGGAQDNTFTGRREAGGLDTQLHAGPLDVWTEYLRARFRPLDAVPASSFDADGWYLLAALYVVPKTLQAVVRYEDYDPNLAVTGGRTRTWTLGANWYLKANDLKLQFNYLLTDLDGTAALNKKLLMRLQSVF